MKKILFPTDFSDNANKALEFAIEIVRSTKGLLHLLHVVTPMVSKSNVVRSFLTEELADSKLESSQQLDIIKSTIHSEYPEVVCSTEVRLGEVVNEIIDEADKANCDLIIMGTLGTSTLSKVIFGSNTAAVIEKANCPVMAVPINYKIKKPERILFATNFNQGDIEAINKLTMLANVFKSEIVLAHVDTSMDEDDDSYEQMKTFYQQVKNKVSYSPLTYRVINDQNVSMGLDRLIEELEIDILSLSTRKHTWINKFISPSLTSAIFYYTQIPLLAFHAKEEESKSTVEAGEMKFIY